MYRYDGRIHSLQDALHSSPERKHLADARHLPFGEDADEFAVPENLRGFAQRMDHFAWTLLRRDGNHSENLRERLDDWVFVRILEHQKADGPVAGGDHQTRIHHGGVVRNEQRAASDGDVFSALNVDPVERVRCEPQQQPQERIWEQVQNIPRGGQRRSRSPEENCRRAQMRQMCRGIIDDRREPDSNERQQVCRADHAALFLLLGPMLNQGIDGNDEEAGSESERRQKQKHSQKGETMPRKEKSKNGHAHCAERNQAVFDLSAGEIPSRETPHSDAHRHGGLQKSVFCVADLEDTFAVENDVELQ